MTRSQSYLCRSREPPPWAHHFRGGRHRDALHLVCRVGAAPWLRLVCLSPHPLGCERGRSVYNCGERQAKGRLAASWQHVHNWCRCLASRGTQHRRAVAITCVLVNALSLLGADNLCWATCVAYGLIRLRTVACGVELTSCRLPARVSRSSATADGHCVCDVTADTCHGTHGRRSRE